MQTTTFWAAGRDWTVEIPAGGNDGGIARVQESISHLLRLDDSDRLVLEKSLTSVINGFIGAVEGAGKQPHQIYLLVGSKRMEMLFMHHASLTPPKPELSCLGG